MSEIPGPRGKSAYRLAQEQGFKGTLAEWLASLRGERGPPGESIRGEKGERGEPGESVRGEKGERGDKGDRGERGEAGAEGKRGLRGYKGAKGVDGEDGWTPLLAVVEDGDRRVLQIIGWSRDRPATGYLGAGGITDISEAADIRGARGFQPSGASDAGLRRLISDVALSEADVLALIEAHTMPVEDFDAVYLDDQTSDGSVLTFTFDEDVQKVWVKLLPADADDNSTARVRVDGGEPDSDTGTQIEAGVPQPITAETSVVKVLAPNGKTVNVYGYRRKT